MLPWTEYNILLVLLLPGIAKIDIGCGGKLNGRLMVSCVKNIFVKKLLISDNSFLSYNRECPECFSRKRCIRTVHVNVTILLFTDSRNLVFAVCYDL